MQGNFNDAYESITSTIASLLRDAGKPTPSDNANIYDDVYAAIVFISMLRQAIHHYIDRAYSADYNYPIDEADEEIGEVYIRRNGGEWMEPLIEE